MVSLAASCSEAKETTGASYLKFRTLSGGFSSAFVLLPFQNFIVIKLNFFYYLNDTEFKWYKKMYSGNSPLKPLGSPPRQARCPCASPRRVCINQHPGADMLYFVFSHKS